MPAIWNFILTGASWFLLSVLLIVPPLVQGGTPRLPTAAIALAILALVALQATAWGRMARRELRLTILDGFLALFLFWALFSVLFAPYYHPAEQALLLFCCSGALFWMLVLHPSFTGLGAALTAVRFQALFQSVFVLWQHYRAGIERPAGTFFNPNFLAGFLAAAILVCLGEVIFPGPAGGRRPAVRAARAAECVLLLAALLLTGSRGGMFSLAVGMLVLFGLRAWKLALAVGVVGVGALFAIPNPWIERLQTLPEADVFAYTRFSIWKSAAKMMLDHPWVGTGLGQFEYISERYAFPITGHWAKYTRVAENAHSEYLQVGAEMGVVGLLLWLAAVAFLAVVAWRRVRAIPPGARGEIVPLLAGLAAVLAHAAVDFNLHTPPAILLLVLFAAGLRLRGVTGPEHVVDFRFRPAYGALVVLLALLGAAMAIRPVAGFALFLRGIGAPVNLLREKWALEEAPKREVPPPEAVRFLGLAARVDFVCAPYHRALGSRHFQAYLRGEAGDDARRRGLYHLNYAIQLNPNNYQYFVNLGQAMTSLARRDPPGTAYLREAVGHFEHAAELAPRKCWIYQEIGKLYDELGEPGPAETNLRRAVEFEEYNLLGWRDLGAFYARRGRFEEARAAFERGAELSVASRKFVPTSPNERELIALEPAVFYNDLAKVRKLSAGGS